MRLGGMAALLAGGCDPVTRLSTVLDNQSSATTALTQWCEARQIANPAQITATPILGDDLPLPDDGRALLALPAGEQPGYRHVRLSCGSITLSNAHNWYVRSRLTPDMNATLASTNTPFGTVAAPLRFIRQPLASARGAAGGCPAGTVLSHRALLRLPSGEPLALVVECYTAENLREP